MYYIFLSWAENPVVTNCKDNDVRLVGGPTALEGRVEVCNNKVWSGMCHYGLDSRDANVVCSQLGYKSTGKKQLFWCINAKLE